jgi:hypothetical protein
MTYSNGAPPEPPDAGLMTSDARQVLSGTLDRLRKSTHEQERYLALRDGAQALSALGDQGGLDHLSDVAIDLFNIPAYIVSGVLAQGINLDYESRSRVENGPPDRPSAERPLPLIPDLAPSTSYPVAALGPILGGATNGIAHKVQLPPAIAAQSVLATAALAAQPYANVHMPFGQLRPLSLFFVSIAASGDRKTTADNEALWPIRKREHGLALNHAQGLQDWYIRFAAWEAEKTKIEGDKN